MNDTQFIFTCCQLGAERALKTEIERGWPQLRFAFSRPGFVTFKNTEDKHLADSFDLKSIFARTHGFSLGQVKGTDVSRMTETIRETVGAHTFDILHLWRRDSQVPGHKLFSPGPSDQDQEIACDVAGTLADAGIVADSKPNQPAKLGQHVLNVIVIDEQHWWIGRHSASSRVQCLPGGCFKKEIPKHAVSRAYLKMMEALHWSRLPIHAGDAWVEIGSAPGGSCQALLDRGLHVTGTDPSDMHPDLNANPNFAHVKKRGADVRRKEFAKFKWLSIDTNVAPKHTLDTLEGIVTHESVHIHGMLITLKLLEWDLADQIPSYVQRIRSWGYQDVRTRQLTHNRQEICVAAVKNKALRRLARRSQQMQQ